MYVYTTSGGAPTATIPIPNDTADQGDTLGTSVAISGSTIVAGAPGWSQGDGRVFYYDLSGNSTGGFHAVNGSNDELGTSVAISGTTVAAGCRGSGQQW